MTTNREIRPEQVEADSQHKSNVNSNFTALAHTLHQQGFHVFPVDHPGQPRCIGKHRTCDGSRGKHPTVAWGTWAQTVTHQMIDIAWNKHRGVANIGIACGPSQLVVLDEDEPGELDRWCADHGISLPETYTVKTGRGRHLYYRWDHDTQRIGNVPKAVKGYNIDVRGDGGYVVGEGSQHEDGSLYTGNGAPVTKLSDDAAQYLLSYQREADPPSAEAPLSGQQHVGIPLDKHAGVIRFHERHHELVSYAGRLRDLGLALHEAIPVFKQRWLDCEQPEGQIPEARYHSAACEYPVTWDEARAKLADVFGRYPAGKNLDADAGKNSDPNVTHSGQLGMAVKMANRFAGKLLYVHPIGWHRWDGKRWAPDADGAARRAVHTVIKHERAKLGSLPVEDRLKRAKEIGRFETASAITGILTEASVLSEMSVSVSQLDTDPWLFNCANGTLDLHTMELRDHDPADRITKVARGAYRPGVKSQQWEAFNATVLPDADVRIYWQRLNSLALLGKVTGDKQILPIVTGEGANGKTTAIEAISFAMGDYAQPAEPELLMARQHDAHPTGIADLRGKRLVTISETKQDRRLDIPTMKRLTGGDRLKARFMRKDFFEFEPSHLLMMHTNHLPRVDDDTEAVWRRIRAIPFTVQIPEDQRDEQLGDRLQLDADAVLTWLIDGWIGYREHGLQTPEAVLNETNRYKAESDAVGRFIADECRVGGAQSSATTGQLYERWQRWAARENAPELSKIAFGRALDRKGFPVDQNTRGWRRSGICLQTDGQVTSA